MENNSWENFWKNHASNFDTVMYKATQCFAERYLKKFPIKAGDRLLDFGCGPGYFLQFIPKDISFVLGVDISQKYIDICKTTFKNNSNFSFEVNKVYQFEELKKNIAFHNINKIVVLSVFQYYPSTLEVEKFLDILNDQAFKDKKIELVIADILPPKHNLLKDVKDIAIYSLKNRYFFDFIKFAFHAVFSKYNAKDSTALLHISPLFFKTYAEKNGLNYKIINDLTLHSGRYSVQIDYNGHI